jgi:hypothetical protein
VAVTWLVCDTLAAYILYSSSRIKDWIILVKMFENHSLADRGYVPCYNDRMQGVPDVLFGCLLEIF